MKQSLLLLFLALGWPLASCQPAAITSQPPSPVPTASIETTQPPEPEVTATVQPNETATGMPVEIALPSATPAVIATIMALSQPRLYASDLSPDGKWRAEVLVYDCVPVGEGGENAYEQLRLVQVASNRTEIADSQLRSCGGLGAFGLAGLFWSPNSGYFYYTDAREGGPDGCPGYWEPPFLRVNVSNLESEYLGSGARSPDGTKLATWQELELVVWDVDDGEITRLPALDPAATTGPVAWSPDSQVLVYLQFDSVCTFSGPSRLVRVDIPGSKQTLLLQSESPTFIKAAWDEPDFLTLSEENGNIWSYRFSTTELQPSP